MFERADCARRRRSRSRAASEEPDSRCARFGVSGVGASAADNPADRPAPASGPAASFAKSPIPPLSAAGSGEAVEDAVVDSAPDGAWGLPVCACACAGVPSTAAGVCVLAAAEAPASVETGAAVLLAPPSPGTGAAVLLAPASVGTGLALGGPPTAPAPAPPSPGTGAPAAPMLLSAAPATFARPPVAMPAPRPIPAFLNTSPTSSPFAAETVALVAAPTVPPIAAAFAISAAVRPMMITVSRPMRCYKVDRDGSLACERLRELDRQHVVVPPIPDVDVPVNVVQR